MRTRTDTPWSGDRLEDPQRGPESFTPSPPDTKAPVREPLPRQQVFEALRPFTFTLDDNLRIRGLDGEPGWTPEDLDQAGVRARAARPVTRAERLEDLVSPPAARRIADLCHRTRVTGESTTTDVDIACGRRERRFSVRIVPLAEIGGGQVLLILHTARENAPLDDTRRRRTTGLRRGRPSTAAGMFPRPLMDPALPDALTRDAVRRLANHLSAIVGYSEMLKARQVEGIHGGKSPPALAGLVVAANAALRTMRGD